MTNTDPTTPPDRITVAALRALDGADVVVVDVRSAAEYADGHVDGAIHLPADELAAHLDRLRSATTVVTVCTKGGGRSQAAAATLRSWGLPDVRFLDGGTLAWRDGTRG